MSYLIRDLLEIVHTLEDLQLNLRHRHQWEAASSIDTPVGLIRAQIEIADLEYERAVKG